MTKILINPTMKDVDTFLVSKDVHKERTTRIKGVDKKTFEDFDSVLFPFNKDDFVKENITEEEGYWTADYEQYLGDIDNALEWYWDEWEEYCQGRGIDPEGTVRGVEDGLTNVRPCLAPKGASTCQKQEGDLDAKHNN